MDGYQWLKVRGRDKPMPWNVTLLAFPAAGPRAKHNLAAENFAQYSNRSRKHRIFLQRAAGKASRYRIWEFYDDFRPTGGSVVYHTIAAVYDVKGKQMALQMRWPTDSEAVDPEWRNRAMSMVTSLKAGAKKPGKDVGSTRYYVAGACITEGREVAVVVNIPMPNGGKPQRALLQRARKMVKSLREDKTRR